MKIKKNIQRGMSFIPFVIAAGVMAGLLFFPVLTIQAEPLAMEELVSKIQETYEKTEDLKARFVQEMTIKAMKKTDREEGMVYIKNPKRMLWHYLKPSVKKLIINPKNAWLYVPEDKVVYLQNAEGLLKSKLIVKFLSGVGKLSDDFKVAFSKSDPVDGTGNYLVTLIPKESDFGVDKLFVTIHKETFLIIQCSFTDMYGNITRIRFSDIKTNTKLSNNLFTFKPPQGVEVFNVP
jgi:outer membrane lipoprotein carrier protein